MPTEYIPSNQTESVIFNEVLEHEEFAEFFANDITVKLVFKAQFKKDELVESKPHVKLMKYPPLWKASTGGGNPPDYVVVFDKYTWGECDGTERRRLIHTALSSVKIDVNDAGEASVKKRYPDIVTYAETVSRYGLDTHAMDIIRTLTTSGNAISILVRRTANDDDDIHAEEET